MGHLSQIVVLNVVTVEAVIFVIKSWELYARGKQHFLFLFQYVTMDVPTDESRLEIDMNIGDNEENQDSALLNIPVEIFLHICSFLDARFISDSLSLVCKHFNAVLSDKSVWKSRVAKTFDGVYPALPVDDPDEIDWLEACANIEDEYNLWHHKDVNMERILLKDIHYASVDAVLLTKSGSVCFSGSRDHNLVAWSLHHIGTYYPTPKKVIENAHRGWIWNLASHNEKLYSCSWDATVKIWDIEEDLRETSVLSCNQPALALACDTATMAVGLFSHRVMLFDPRTSNRKISSYKAHTGAVLSLALVNGYIVSASEDKSIIVWDHRAFKLYKRIRFSDESLGSNAYPMCLSCANDIIYIGDVRGQVHLMDPKQGEFSIVQSYNVGHTGKMTAINHTAGSVMTCSSDGTMRIHAPTRKLEPIGVIKSLGGEITKFDYKNKILAMGTTENVVEVWMPKNLYPNE